MSRLLIPGLTGLLLGLILHWTGLSHPWHKPWRTVLAGITALGWTLLLGSLLSWLAVLPPEAPRALTLHLLRFALLYALSAWICGYAPLTALAGFRFRPAEALCVLLGCAGGSLLPLDASGLWASADALLSAHPALPGWLGAACVTLCLPGAVVLRKRL